MAKRDLSGPISTRKLLEAAVDGKRKNDIEFVLDLLSSLLPYSYAQWVTESSSTWDYTVVASRFPSGGDCYEIAHRPGVIGQVFRRERSIFIANAQTHPLYDVFDPSVKWELAVPLLEDGCLAAVLNLEGNGYVELNDARWRSLGDVIYEKTGLQLPDAAPPADEAWMVKTTRVKIAETTELSAVAAALQLGRAVASGGMHVLVAGALDLPKSITYPAVEEALTNGFPLGGCFRGGGLRLDLLQIEASGVAHLADSPWWSLADGRYDFVLVA